MKENAEKIKIMSIRLPKSLWKFLKDLSCENEISMNEIFIYLISKHKKSLKDKLTKIDVSV